jgi:hypothetical protein
MVMIMIFSSFWWGVLVGAGAVAVVCIIVGAVLTVAARAAGEASD